MRSRFAVLAVTAAILLAPGARADCVNKFTSRGEGTRHIVTLLTGKLTFQAARALSAAIREGKAEPLEWVESSGKRIARQFGELRVVRPMPVGCDGNPSGVIMIAVFPTVQQPGKTMIIKLNRSDRVEFELQR